MKKIIALMLVLVSLCALTLSSCSLIFGAGFSDPIKLGKKLVKEYDDEVRFTFGMSGDMEDIAEEFDIKDDGIYAAAFIYTEDDGDASVIYFTKSSYAKDAEKDAAEFIEDMLKEDKELDEDDYIIKRSGKALYIGSKDIIP